MDKAKAESRKKNPPPSIVTGLVFELEKLAIPGRRILFETCQKILKDKQVSMTPAHWSRFVLDMPLEQGFGRLLAALGKKSVPAEKLVGAVQDAFCREISRPAVKWDAALNALLTEAAKLNFKTGALSFLPEEQAKALLVQLALPERVVLSVAKKPAGVVSTPDCWLMACKTIGIPAYRCVAVVESAAACKAALEAGLRCVVVPDEFTAHQDFAGADQVSENLSDVHAKDLQALLRSCAFR